MLTMEKHNGGLEYHLEGRSIKLLDASLSCYKNGVNAPAEWVTCDSSASPPLSTVNSG